LAKLVLKAGRAILGDIKNQGTMKLETIVELDRHTSSMDFK